MTDTEEKPRCRECGRLESKDFSDVPSGRVEALGYRCTAGRFDGKFTKDGSPIPTFYTWGGVVKPNKTVAAAQKDCREFVRGNPR